MPFDEEELDPHGECRTEIERLRVELGRAYRCIRGFWTATKEEKVLDKTTLAYHSPTIAAACRFVADGALDGSEYFIGKHISVMREALYIRLPHTNPETN